MSKKDSLSQQELTYPTRSSRQRFEELLRFWEVKHFSFSPSVLRMKALFLFVTQELLKSKSIKT